MTAVPPVSTITGMHADRDDHHRLCTIELIAGVEASRCPDGRCAFWERGCILERVESELEERPDVARLLLEVRLALESGATTA